MVLETRAFCSSFASLSFRTASTDLSVCSCSSLMIFTIPSVDSLLWAASFLISSATTAKPFPLSPALALSMAALSDSRFVCSDMLDIRSVMVRISSDFCFRSSIMLYALSLFSLTSADLPFSFSMISIPSETTSAVFTDNCSITPESFEVSLIRLCISCVSPDCVCIFAAVSVTPFSIS